MVSKAELLVHSAGAAASLSRADASFDGVKNDGDDKANSLKELITWVVYVTALSSIATALLAIYFEASHLRYAAFVFPLLTGPVVLVQRAKIQMLPTFREKLNDLRMEIGNLAIERIRLTNENNRLERQVNRMSGIEERFEDIVKREQKDVGYFRNIIKENKSIQQEIKKQQDAAELLRLFEAVSRADRDRDGTISDSDLKSFIRRVKVLYPKGRLDEKQLRAAFETSLSQSNVSLYNAAASVLSASKSAEEADIELQQLRRNKEDPPGAIV